MYMLMLVLDDPGKLQAVLNAWEDAGISGATIVESTGIQRIKARKKLVPLLFPFNQVGVSHEEEGHLTLFTILRDEEIIQKCIRATEEVTGNLDLPNTGILAVWPITYVKGVANAKDHA
ncbi:MAG: hypothetical protein HPY45_10405 [Anaerolineae bacterium]|nr:hypothetical protein [Anaerolineae bacterium]